MIVASSPPGGGRYPLTSRFTRYFNLFCLPEPSEKILSVIFTSILEGFIKSHRFNQSIRSKVDNVVDATIGVYKNISVQLLPIPAKFHYEFNPRDISKVF